MTPDAAYEERDIQIEQKRKKPPLMHNPGPYHYSTNEAKLERINQGVLGRFWRSLGRVGYFLAGVNPVVAQQRAIEKYNVHLMQAHERRIREQRNALVNPLLAARPDNGLALSLLRLQNTMNVYNLDGQPYELKIKVRLQ